MGNQIPVRDATLIVAVDFGTSYSGYAFQFYYQHQKDRTKIDSPQAFNSSSSKLASTKTSTCLLLNERKEIDEFGFGFDAEDKYLELCFKKDNKKYYFFRRFKMHLQDGQGLTESSMIPDETGKEMLAIDVFALSIKCLKTHLMNLLRSQGRDIEEESIFWVLTVPAIWNDAAKHFMREAAIKVGGTADMTVHEKLEDGRLKELSKASGGPWGGTAVDSAFLQTFISIVGGPVMNQFRTDNTYDYLTLCNDFEAVKRNVSQKRMDIRIKLPPTLDKQCEEHWKHGFMKCLEESVHSKEISLRDSNLSITPQLVEKLFRKATDHIVDHMTSILEEGPVKGISHILMVGGFSESPFVQNVVRGAFDGKNGLKVIIPKDAGITIAKGAVLYGRFPKFIESRVLRFTYGLRVTTAFIEGTHPEERKLRSDTGLLCKDVFDIILSAETEVKSGFSVEKTYSTVNHFQNEIHLNVYYTNEKHPRFTTDPGCKLLGGLNVTIPNPSKDKHKVDVTFQFGMPELKISAREQSNKTCTTKLNMID
ncbi:hypothetical protein ACJMK2_039591 [Sinanodonta woodiana]|uniref:Uncharacterized protein n=1 Tax=Sinanodonta woodiana TaxID=1069815 RepID=A0ABD3WGF9_SINWO